MSVEIPRSLAPVLRLVKGSLMAKLLRECVDGRTTQEVLECGKRIGYRAANHVWQDLMVLRGAGAIRLVSDEDGMRWVVTPEGRKALELLETISP
ncbi:MAG: hypothetical protein GXO32_05060 [Crenarchaeota archaeon]|nr:hypothetical protein [Thermoproteota archaeon]